MWSDQEKKIQNIDRLSRSLLIQGLSNDTYSLIDSNKTVKDLWDALARHMRGSEYGEQDRKAAVLYEYETFKATQGELLLDIYIRYLQVINDLKKCGYSKDNCELNFNDSNQEINENMVFMAQIEKVLSDSEASSSSSDEKIIEIAKCLKRIEKANQQNNDFENQNKDLQDKYDVLKNQATTFKMKNNELNEEIKVLIKKNDDFLAQTNVLKDQLQVKHVVIDTHVECQEKYAKLEAKRYEYMIRYSAYFDNDKQHRKQIAVQEVLCDKMSVQLVELDKHVRDLKNTILEKDFKISKFEECVRNKDLEIKKCLECLNDCENKLHKMGQTNQTVHMIMPSKDKMYNGRKGIGFENSSNFCKAKDLRPTLYDERVINLGYVNEKINFSDDYFQEIINPDFDKIDYPFQQTSSLKPYVPTVILEKIIIDLEDEVVSILEKEKANLKTIESLKSKGFESSEKVVSETKNKSEDDCQVIEKVYDSEENPNVIAPEMFKLSVSQSVSPISVTKTSCASNSVE
nr:hypothetical protein [Tanacetum cinerariifolium]